MMTPGARVAEQKVFLDLTSSSFFCHFQAWISNEVKNAKLVLGRPNSSPKPGQETTNDAKIITAWLRGRNSRILAKISPTLGPDQVVKRRLKFNENGRQICSSSLRVGLGLEKKKQSSKLADNFSPLTEQA